jgi:hypothetical protein
MVVRYDGVFRETRLIRYPGYDYVYENRKLMPEDLAMMMPFLQGQFRMIMTVCVFMRV